MKHSSEEHETKMGDCDSRGADMVVELEAGLSADCDPMSLLLRERRRGLGMYGRASAVRERLMGTNTSSQCTLLASVTVQDHPVALSHLWLRAHSVISI